MVFERVVADLLNRFLGDYVENLDQSQLQIGIFGGDVVLQDLILKQSALDELDLPVKAVYGHLGKLVLKIPWCNLYSAPITASIERLFLLVVPNLKIKYDAEKEEKWKQEAKQAELQRIEEAKKLEKEKGLPYRMDIPLGHDSTTATSGKRYFHSDSTVSCEGVACERHRAAAVAPHKNEGDDKEAKMISRAKGCHIFL